MGTHGAKVVDGIGAVAGRLDIGQTSHVVVSHKTAETGGWAEQVLAVRPPVAPCSTTTQSYAVVVESYSIT